MFLVVLLLGEIRFVFSNYSPSNTGIIHTLKKMSVKWVRGRGRPIQSYNHNMTFPSVVIKMRYCVLSSIRSVWVVGVFNENKQWKKECFFYEKRKQLFLFFEKDPEGKKLILSFY